MLSFNEGATLCFSCFKKRESSAVETKTDNIMKSNWGLYLIPFVNSIALISKANKCETFPDGNIYHIYIDMNDEQWSKNKNLGTCSECRKFVNTYYQLEKKESDIFIKMKCMTDFSWLQNNESLYKNILKK